MVKQRIYSKYAHEAAMLMGKQIKLGRKQREWSAQSLADRAGISRSTLQKIENGEMSSAIGLVFEVASLVDIMLFEPARMPISKSIEHVQDKIALLPQRVKASSQVFFDDF